MQNDASESLNVSEWFPNIINDYIAFVSHSFDAKESTMDQNDYFKDYLKGDLQVIYLERKEKEACTN